MRQFFFGFVLMATVVLVAPANNNRKSFMQGRVNTETHLQSPPQQQKQPESVEEHDGAPEAEDPATMTNKINECRSILQQAGMINLGDGAKATEGETENDTEDPAKDSDDKEEEPGNGVSGKRNQRKF